MKAKKVIGYELTCTRCGYVWESKKEHPLRCAKCKTPYWDTPRKIKEATK
jgi:predicted Zn-ribbon and HTH transcriptional regulator